MRTVRDALYDLIEIGPAAQALISTPEFLRLDGIQQLGFVSRVWPGARHSRFEHSLGVMHLTSLAVAHLTATYGTTWFTETDGQTTIAAALLHDIGHYPFSHAVEELGAPVLSHEKVGREIVASGNVAEILRSQWQLNPDAVAAMIHGEQEELTSGQRLLRGLLSGTLDMDKLDYLPRDAHGCSVPYGGVDTSRLLSSLTVVEPPGSMGIPRLGIGDKGISPLHSLINARQEMFDNVYWHHTNRACMIMLLRAVQEAMVAGKITAASLTNHNDASLIAFLRSDAMPKSTRNLANALAQRQIHKRAVEVSAGAFELYARLGNLYFDANARRQVELDLSSALGNLLGESTPPTAILIDIPKPERWKTDVWVQFERPPVGFRPLMPWREVAGIGDDDLKRYEEHRRLIRIVTEARYREVVAEHWEQLLYPLLGGVF